ncbi:MAG: LEA type 2 family protein [Moraxellaceae bacterium]|nr:LEA type 2 family protein [Moraxellaceae bacterium]
MSSPIRKLLAVLVSVLVLGGCASLLGLKSPEVTLADIQLADSRLLEQRFRLTLRVTNPNDRELALEGVSFQMEVNGQRFAQGVGATPVVVPKLGDALVTVEGSAQIVALLRQLPRLAESGGKLRYRLRGEAITRDFGRLPFDRGGEFDPVSLLEPAAKPRAESL